MSPSKSVVLRGLQPQPLASYLGALGVLRVLATQWSASTRGAFTREGFAIFGVSEEELLELFSSSWRPSPVLTPWNNASGFYDSSKGRLAAAAMAAIVKAGDPRFAALVASIESVREMIGRAKYTEAPKDEEKAGFIANLRGVLPDEAVAWLDAVAVVEDDDARMMPLLGSGGNEGVLDYSGMFLRSIADTLLGDRARSERLLRSALLGTLCTELVERPGGQFEPGSAGGFNTGPGFETKGLPNNPWSFSLLIEGAQVWASALASRQQGLGTRYRFAVSPFTVRHRAAGYGSASNDDNDPQRVRAEVWVPIWARPAGLAEVSHFIAEGRVDVSGRGGPKRATDSLDFLDAVASLGVDRGVDAFVRYALIKRRGDAYLALPAGVLPVARRREVDLLRQLDGELDLLDQFFSRFPSEHGPPAQLTSARRAVDEARFEVAARGGRASVTRLVRKLGALEMVLARRDPGKAPQLLRPLGGLGPEWVGACEDTTEVRIAAALASIRKTGGVGPIRCYLAPLDPKQPRKYAAAFRATAWAGMTTADRLASVLSRRVLDAERTGSKRAPTFGTRTVAGDDVAAFLSEGLVDDRAIEELLFGFTWVSHDDAGRARMDGPPGPPLPRTYATMRLLFAPAGVPFGGERIEIAPDSAILGLLRAGRVGDAVERARHRLRAAGFRPRRVTSESPSNPELGRRLAAALLIPICESQALAGTVLLPDARETNQEVHDVD